MLYSLAVSLFVPLTNRYIAYIPAIPTIAQITLSNPENAAGGDPRIEPIKSMPKKPIIPNLIAAAITNIHVTVLIKIHFLKLINNIIFSFQ